MIKLRVWIKDEPVNGFVELDYLRPRRYMCGYSFDQVYTYARHQIENYGLNRDQIIGFEFYNEREHWFELVKKEEH